MQHLPLIENILLITEKSTPTYAHRSTSYGHKTKVKRNRIITRINTASCGPGSGLLDRSSTGVYYVGERDIIMSGLSTHIQHRSGHIWIIRAHFSTQNTTAQPIIIYTVELEDCIARNK